MADDVNNEEEGIIFGAVTRKLTGLEVGMKHEASFEIQTDGAHQFNQVDANIFRNSRVLVRAYPIACASVSLVPNI